MLSSFKRRIGRIQRCHSYPILTNVFHQIRQCGIAGNFAGRHPLDIIGIVKIGRHLGPAELSPIIAHVENLGRNVVKKTQKAANAFGNVRFASRGQADHDQYQLVIGGTSNDFQWSGIFPFG
jgi:hypothetical protein